MTQKRIVEVVPPLGESITEGSIAKWTKAVGDRIDVDDVVVIVETDKVTVDIKSTHAGVLSKRLAEDLVSDGICFKILFCFFLDALRCFNQVIVGKDLYEIETELAELRGDETISASHSTVAKTPAAAITATDDATKKNIHAAGGRIPLIKFIGKRDHTKRVPVATPTGKPLIVEGNTAAPSRGAEPNSKPQTGVDFTTLKMGAWYGRPQLTASEIDAVASGGATVTF